MTVQARLDQIRERAEQAGADADHWGMYGVSWLAREDVPALLAVAEAAQAVVKNWRGNAHGWVNIDEVSPALDALRAALTGLRDKDG